MGAPLKKWLAAAAALLLLTSAGLYLLVRSAYVQGLIKARVVSAVEESLNARLEVGSVSGNPLRGLTFHDVRLSLPGGGGRLLEARRLRVSYALSRLLLRRGAWRLNLRLDGFRLDIVRGPDGRYNLQRLLKGRPGPRQEVRLGRIRLGEGTVRLSLEGKEAREYLLEQLTTKASATIITGPRPEAALRLERASFALVRPRALRVDRLAGAGRLGPGGELSARLVAETAASVLRLDVEAGADGGPVKLEAKAAPIDLVELSGLVPGLPRGKKLAGEVDIEGPRQAAKVKADLTLDGARLTSAGTLDLRRLSLRDIEEQTAGLSLTLRDFDPAAVSAAARRAGLTGKLNADVRLAPLPTGRGVGIEADVLPSRLAGRELSGGKVAASLEKGRLRLSRANLDFSFGRLSMTGEVSDVANLEAGPLAARLSGRITQLDLARLTGRRGLVSDIGAGFELKAERKDGRPLAGAASLEMTSGSMFSGYRFQEGEAAASLADGRLELQRLRIVSPLIGLEASGSATDRKLALDYEVRTKNLGGLVHTLEPELTKAAAGRLALKGRAGGTLQAPTLEARLEGGALGYGGYSIEKLTGSLSSPDLRKLSRASLALRATNIRSGDKQQLEQVGAEASIRGTELAFKAAAIAGPKRSLRLAGTGTNITASSAELRLSEVRLEAPGLEVTNTAPMKASFSKKGFSLSGVSLAASDGTLRLSGDAARGRLDLILRLRALPLSEWLPPDSPLSGKASGFVRLTGTLAEPRLAGQLSLAGGELGPVAESRFSLEQAGVSFDYAAGSLHLEALLAHKGSHLEAAGSVPVTVGLWPPRARLGERGLDVTLRAERFDLGLLSAVLAPKVQVSGQLSASLTARGDPAVPQIEGQARIEDGALYAPKPTLSLRHVQAQLAFDRNRVRIEHLEAESNGGKALVTGTMGLRGKMPLELDVQASDYRVYIREDSWARVNARLAVTGSRQAPTVKGEADIEEARLIIPEEMVPSLREIRVVETLAELKKPEEHREGTLQSLQRQVEVSVKLRARNRVYVTGRGLDAEFSLDLEAVKAREGKLKIIGTADSIRGTYSIKGKTLTIEKAQAVFTGESTTNPDLSARLTYDAGQQTTIVVAVSGSVSKPRIDVSSEPPMDQTSVYSYFFLGQPAEKLGGGEQRVLQQQVASLVGGAAAQQVTGALGQGLGLDTFDLTPAEGQLGLEAVSVGKYLTRDLFVTFQRSFGVEQQDQVLINYRLSHQFSVESQFGAEQTTGFDVFWNYDFSYLFK